MRKLTFIGLAILAAIATGHATPDEPLAEGFMVGGNNAVARQFRFVASLQDSVYGHFCNGAIISQRWILTAASCVINRRLTIQARVGSLLHNSGGVLHETRTTRMHPNFNFVSRHHDIALLQTVHNIVFDAITQPIGLTGQPVYLDSRVTVIGWGRTTPRTDTAVPQRLQFFRGNTITTSDCQSLIRAANFERQVLNTNVCLRPQSGVGICSGSGGGPIVLDNQLVGVTSSFVVRCAAGVPDVHTRLEYYINWIAQNSRF